MDNDGAYGFVAGALLAGAAAAAWAMTRPAPTAAPSAARLFNAEHRLRALEDALTREGRRWTEAEWLRAVGYYPAVVRRYHDDLHDCQARHADAAREARYFEQLARGRR